MLIPINVNIPGPSSSPQRQLPPQLAQFGSDELVLIEMQGALEVEGNKDQQLVGKLRVDPATKKPTLLIGHHLLEGKLVNLSKPLAILHRNARDAVEGSAPEDAAQDQPKDTPTSWDIVAVVKRKMVFSKRPMPMVGRPSGTVPLSRIGSKA
ncbi:Ctf8-domain-containing protein [Trametes polyzona]|nr:Ctf8-domain-containing protein [Trametes polyzona]